MPGISIHMTAKKKNSLQEIYKKINYMKGAEQVSKSTQTINDVEIWMLVFEKYYLRMSNYIVLTIVLTEHGEEQTASIVATGGGEGVVNYSFGAKRNFAKACVEELESCGFIVNNSDLEIGGNGIFERILK